MDRLRCARIPAPPLPASSQQVLIRKSGKTPSSGTVRLPALDFGSIAPRMSFSSPELPGGQRGGRAQAGVTSRSAQAEVGQHIAEVLSLVGAVLSVLVGEPQDIC